MSVALPVASVVFGSVTPSQGDIVDLRVHFGCSNEISSFDCLLQNFDKKYSSGGTYPINVGVDGSISVGRGVNCPLILTLKVEEIEPLSTATENYIRVRGRCWGEHLFRRLVTKCYDNAKGEAVVKDIIDSYTSLSHVRSSVELIEDTDTTYTRLDYEDTPVFDIIKYIAETADKAGAIGYDFRIAPDGKFEFFPKNSKTSSVSLSERLEVSEYAKNIHRIKNKITVYGAAERTKPSNEDSWTDGTADQSQSDVVEDSHSLRTYQLVSTLTFTPSGSQKIALKKVKLDAKMDASGTHTGQYKVTYQKGAGAETNIVTDQSFTNTTYEPKENTCAINGDFGEQITVRFYTRVSAGPYDGELVYSKNYYMIYDLLTYDWDPDQAGLGITLDATEKQQGACSVRVSATAVTWAGATLTLADADIINGNKFANINVKVKLESTYKGSGQIYLYSTQIPPNNYVSQPINVTLGVWQNLSFAVGRKNRSQWFGNPTTFDWAQIKKIRLVFDLVGTNSGDFLFDHMFFGAGRWEATREDSASQTNYGLREKVETDEELHSDAECDYRAKALLDFLKGPIETLKVSSEVVDYGTTPILAADKIHVTIPNENIDSDYRIISAEYRASGKEQTLEVELELAREPLLLADFIYGFRKSIQKLDKYKAGVSGAGGVSGGGGGMVQHANEWHNPDMALQSDFASHKDRHKSGGADAFVLADLLDAVARVKVRKNSGASDIGARRRLNLIEGSNVTLTVTDDPTDEEVDVTIASAGGGGNVPEPIAEDILGGWKRIFQLPFTEQYDWTKVGTVLTSGQAGKFDAQGVAHPCVIKIGDYYYLFYSGYNSGAGKHAIGVARATNPSGPYTRLNNGDAIITDATYACRCPSVIYDHYETDANKKWKMIFHKDIAGSLNLYYSYSANPDSGWSAHTAIGINGVYWGHSFLRFGRLYYLAVPLTSGDLKLYVSKYPDSGHIDLGTCLSKGASGAWDDAYVRYVTASYILGGYYIFYSGQQASGTTLKIGMALSPYGALFDGQTTYAKFRRNPILQEQPTTFCYAPSLLIVDDTFYMWYASGADDIRLAKIP